MEFKVTLEDFWWDGDEDSIEEALKKHIVQETVQQIEKNLQKKIDEEIARCVKQQVENILLKKISGEVARLVEIGEIRPNKKEDSISIVDYIKNQFESNSGWRSPDETIKAIAKKFGDEMKMRYDRAFAVHIVERMRENGLLKEKGIVDLLKLEKSDL